MPARRRTGAQVSVIIPTYNRAELLRGSLAALAAQQPPDGGGFEVIVADDGSADETRSVVRDFEHRLDLGYWFQEDRGFRAAAARNAGARLASAPVLVFLDAGVRPGAGFVRAHLAAHSAPPAGQTRAVVGYTYGYRPDADPLPRSATGLPRTPEEIVRRHGHQIGFQDVRHLAFERFGFDLGTAVVPWQWFWSLNCSVRAADFWEVGGFDEDFRSWGGEDLDLGYRLHRRGTAFTVSRDAWALDTPHERSVEDDLSSGAENVLMMARKHPEPVTELLWAWFAEPRDHFEISHDWNVEDEYLLVLRAAEQARGSVVTNELAALRELPAGTRVAVFGCGPVLPEGLPSAELFDFDGSLAGPSPSGGRVRHALGVRTPLADQSVDHVLVTSRLSGVWDRWGNWILDEAHRIGRHVDTRWLAADKVRTATEALL
ncbi:glycosyltransferase [Kutzneria viridogrisea]|uniref:Glycosyltransferase involved in cell wall biosynthesis n=1 Tax=Kutzneria viridogrisea TaxID=47990 RepID=A0ABR6BVN9_9PSEU|nr:glycosyltransferase involved in cell wall biosynthesis [Kutzneria viridogrisea]